MLELFVQATSLLNPDYKSMGPMKMLGGPLAYHPCIDDTLIII